MGQSISMKSSDGHSFEAYQTIPEKRPLRGGLVVVQEIFGINAHIRSVVDSFAQEGYAVLAPSLFDRIRPSVELKYDEEGLQEGIQLLTQLKTKESLLDIQCCVDALQAYGKVGIVGYCYGGSMAWASASSIKNLSCAVCYYGGRIPRMLDRPPLIPTLLHFGENDGHIPLEAVEKVKETYPDLPIHIYEGAGHGFNCDHRDDFHKESAQLAKQRTLSWLEQHL